MTIGVRRAVVVGTTAWGTTLALLLARNGVSTVLLAREADEAKRLHMAREHTRRLPGALFPEALAVEAAHESLGTADLICFAVPSRTMAENITRIVPNVSPNAVLLSAAKGLERESGKRMSELLSEMLPTHPVAVISGPNLSYEVAAGLPGTAVIASESEVVTETLRNAFHSSSFRVYSSDDLIGVELGGALKNVFAIAGGIVDALGYGDNAKAAILTRGLAEMTRLGIAAGAEPLTFQGLTGVGDLIATAYSPLSRNRRLGELLGSGVALEQALVELDATAEGAVTTPAAIALARRLGVEMPIALGLEGIIAGEFSPEQVVHALMERQPKPELSDTPRVSQ